MTETTVLNAMISFWDAIDEVASDCDCEGSYDEESPCPKWDDHAKLALGMIEPIERRALVGLPK